MYFCSTEAIIQRGLLGHTVGAVLRTTNFINGLKKGSLRKLFSRIYIGDAYVVRLLFLCGSIIAFSVSALHKNSVWPVNVRL